MLEVSGIKNKNANTIQHSSKLDLSQYRQQGKEAINIKYITSAKLPNSYLLSNLTIKQFDQWKRKLQFHRTNKTIYAK